MKTKIFILLTAGVVLILMAGTVLAGVEPEPFRLSVARLDVAATNISGIATMVDEVMGIDPEPLCPTPDEVKAKELRDLAMQMHRVQSEVEKVMGVDPEPFNPGDGCTGDPEGEVAAGLANIRALTMGVINKAEIYLGIEPTPMYGVYEALVKLKRDSMFVVDTIDAYTNGCEIITPTECVGRTDCTGIFSGGPDATLLYCICCTP